MDLLQNRQKAVLNLQNSESVLQGNRDKAFRLQLDALKRQRKAALDELALREKLAELSVESEQERRDFELKFAKERGDVNDKYAGKLGEIIELNKEATNVESARNLLQTWEMLGDISLEAVGQVSGAIKGLEGDVQDYIREQQNLLKGGLISQDDMNANVAGFVDEQKRILKLFITEMVETADLSEEAAATIMSAVDSINIVAPQGDDAADADLATTDFYINKLKELVGNSLEIFKDFGKEKIDNLKNQSRAELDVIKERYSIEEDILKSNLDNQLITEGQFRVKSAELKKAQLAEENAVNRKLFEAQVKQDRANTVAAGLESIAQATILAYTSKDPLVGAPIQAAISSGVIAATTGAKLAAIGTRKFFPKKFEDGGMVNGPSHAEGGVAFQVQGQGGYEMEGGEFIVNKRSASMHRELLDRINSSGRTSATIGTQKFANGGEVIGSQTTGATEAYLKVIAESNADIAIQSKKPTRAVVSSKDLTTDSRERSIRNNNNRI